ncbi:MAG: TIGR02757 family protein [Desulfomonilia bacterium]
MQFAPPEKKRLLDELYALYNREEFITPDPLQFLVSYCDIRDREIAGVICAGLAYGRVMQICRSVSRVLSPMGHSPRAFLEKASPDSLQETFHGFKHRFTTDAELVDVLWALREVIREHGSLQTCFVRGFREMDRDTTKALSLFVQEIRKHTPRGSTNSLLPCPDKKSACKRFHLYLRWMVRHDNVDPGGWDGIDPSCLVIPLDTHMHRICTALGMTTRRQADLRTALQITDTFRMVSPEDPVKYDFSLTRLGIRSDTQCPRFFQELMSGTWRN